MAGFAQSASIRSRSVLDERLEVFARDLYGRLPVVRPYDDFDDVVSFRCDLAVMV